MRKEISAKEYLTGSLSKDYDMSYKKCSLKKKIIYGELGEYFSFVFFSYTNSCIYSETRSALANCLMADIINKTYLSPSAIM